MQRVMAFATTTQLNNSSQAVAFRALYAAEPGNVHAADTRPRSVLACDVSTSDVYFSGALLAEAFGHYTTLITNGTGKYCMTAQGDKATLEALPRSTVANRTLCHLPPLLC